MAKAVAFTVYWDNDSGEYKGIKEDPEFKGVNSTVRLDIWQDAAEDVHERHVAAYQRQMQFYDAVMREHGKVKAKKMKKMKLIPGKVN